MKNKTLKSYFQGDERKTFWKLIVTSSWTLPHYQKELTETILMPLRKVEQ
jgi:hypothetical protein